MKTFDLALKYLDGLDLSVVDLHHESKDQQLNEKELELLPVLLERLDKFKTDPQNTESNDHYRSMVFTTATMHLAFKQHGHTSFFTVAEAIIEGQFDILPDDCEKFMNTEYPLAMIHAWNDYCSTQPQFPCLREGSEIRYDLFYTAYHYIIDELKENKRKRATR